MGLRNLNLQGNFRSSEESEHLTWSDFIQTYFTAAMHGCEAGDFDRFYNRRCGAAIL